ncbi:MAG: SDR family oxidoreductase [Anaerolineae bacterium]
MPRTRRTALITGASAGIGREFAKVFAEHGFDLVLVARRADKLQQLAEELRPTHRVTVTVISQDLTLEDAAQAVFDKVQGAGIKIDVLVNNAGISFFEAFADTPLDQHVRLLQLNVVALTALTRIFVDPMIERGWGRIINLASVTAFQPTPSLALYGASKAFVLSLSEALAEELRGTGVTVTAVCPGFTDTPMVRNALAARGGQRPVASFLLLDPEGVAREGYRAAMRGKVIQVNGLPYRLTAQLVRFPPRWLTRTIAGLVGRLALSEY